MKINSNYLNLEESYLFSTITKKVDEYKSNHPEKAIISLGIGDITKPLPSAVINAMQKAVSEMGTNHKFKGYGPESGYGFLKSSVCTYYHNVGVFLDEDEVFISDGANSDLGNILDIFSTDNTVLIPDPVYPVYIDTNIMAGRKIIYSYANEENNFLPMPNKNIKADIIFLCSPNNPTGAVYSKNQLKEWVDYALSCNAIIIFDAAYEAFIQDKTLPRSIYEVEGSKKCAIEICSLSKNAGFTGTRCGYTIVPKALNFHGASLNKLWLRRQTTKFNGVSYIIQRGAEAAFTEEGQDEIQKYIQYYMENAKIISNTLRSMNIWFTGGENSPYIWLKCPKGMTSWEFFDYLLENANTVGSPGSGFGKNGKGFFRLTAFGDRYNTEIAMKRISSLF